jgi:uncharacterized RDD family membrane protein YckC
MAPLRAMTVLTGPDPTDVVGRRVAAWFIDGLIGYLVSIAIIYAIGIPQSLERNPEQVDPNQALAFLLSLLVIAVVMFVIRIILIGVYGWTPGKLIMGLRVVRYDGRPPGLGRAAVRSLVDGVGQGFLGCFYDIPALFFAMSTAGHRQPADMAANTYVIDAYYEGRLIIRQGDRVIAGPPSLHREEMAEALREQGIPTPVFIPPDGRITEPFYDKNLDTHVVFSKKRNQWLRFDKKRDTWEPIEDASGGGSDTSGGGRDPGMADRSAGFGDV